MYHILKFEDIFEDEYIKIQIDFNYSIIHPTWKRHPTSEVFRKCFTYVLNLSDKWNIRTFLSDATQINYLEISDQNWVIEQFKTRINNSDVILFARVLSYESLTLFDYFNIINNVNKDYKFEERMITEMFPDLDTATFWLLSTLHST